MDLSTIVVYTVCFLVAAPFVLFLAGFISYFIYAFFGAGWNGATKLVVWLTKRSDSW